MNIELVGLVGLVIILGAAFLCTIEYFALRNLEKLKKGRIKKGATQNVFLDYFLHKGIDQNFSLIVYRYFEACKTCKKDNILNSIGLIKELEDFPVEHSDRIDFYVSTEIFSKIDTITEIIQRYQKNCYRNDRELVNVMWDDIRKSDTVEKLVIAMWNYLQKTEKKQT
jgi:flagellar biosynthesis/type III secretory pathway chaperone